MALANVVDSLGTAPEVTVISDRAIRPCLAIAGGVLAFALLIERVGYLAAVMSTVLITSCASRELNARQALMLAAVVTAVMALLFVGLLDQPFPLVAPF